MTRITSETTAESVIAPAVDLLALYEAHEAQIAYLRPQCVVGPQGLDGQPRCPKLPEKLRLVALVESDPMLQGQQDGVGVPNGQDANDAATARRRVMP
jgi:hypothetical protein